RWGMEHLLGSVQFLLAPDGKVYYRVHGKDGLRQAGQELDVGDHEQRYKLPWQPMSLQFQLAGFLPRGVRRDGFVPIHLRPGTEPSARVQPAVRGCLTTGGRTADFRVRLSHGAVPVRIGDELFLVRYRPETRPVDFELTLKNAQQATDPGTERPAGFQSD